MADHYDFNSVKRKHYFKRVKIKNKYKDVESIDPKHSKFMFTQYVRTCLQANLLDLQETESQVHFKSHWRMCIYQCMINSGSLWLNLPVGLQVIF